MFGLSVRLTGPLAIMPSADRVPVKSSHSTMLWPMWVVLITGHAESMSPTRPVLHYVLSALSSHHTAPIGAIPPVVASPLSGKRDGFPVALALGHHRPGHARDLVGKSIAATFVGRRSSSLASHGRCLVPWILA